MTKTKNILKPLNELGLSKYESKVYLTLISEGISTAKDISNITGIPYGKVYEIINSLSNKGFSMVLPSKPMKYKAASPVESIKKAKNKEKEKIERIESRVINQLESKFKENKYKSKSKSYFSIINGRSNVVNKTEELIAKAKKSINIQCSANSLSRLVLHKDVLKEAVEKGIYVSIAGVTNKENLNEIRSLDFCSIKKINSSKNNFISVDGKECMIIDANPDDDNIIYGRDLGIFALSPSFTRFLDSFFLANFKKAREVKF
ncbi:hypothetical protein GF361_04005 [Candidatus Woesearchaeota archaeon]|nr:hypothetical protein [Candidatus Woesearchaeota archaeon]